jgi:hypothetical protein
MGWQDLLAPAAGEEQILPWLGGRKVHGSGRTWRISGRLPRELGWYRFQTAGSRKATLVGEAEPDDEYGEGRTLVRGYLAGDRLIPDTAGVDPDPAKLFGQTETVHLVELGLDRFTRAVAVRDADDNLVYLRQEFPEGPEFEVQAAYQDRLESVSHIKEVTPALDLAFRWESYQRLAAEERRRELERLAAEEAARLDAEAKLREAMKDAGTGAGRRALAQRDFHAAARAALAISGAELLDARQSRNRNQMVVQYRFRNRRLECEVHKDTLRVVEAGVCLDDHRGTRGDTYFTLESLPAVIGEAMDRRLLHVYRHLDDDYDEDW